MKRRDFLVGAASVVGAGAAGFAQAPAAQAPAAGQAPAGGRRGGGAAGRAGGGGRGGGAGNIPLEKRQRVSLMTLNYSSILKFPWTANPDEAHYLSILDLPQYYMDTYGCPNMEFQHGHLVQIMQGQGQPAPNLEFMKEMRSKLDALKMTASQINIEIGQLTTAAADGSGPVAISGDQRATWLVNAKRWVDASPVIGVKRLMLNQTGLNQQNKAGVISVWKEIQDYAKPKGVMISAEGRGGGGGARGAAAAPGAAAPAAPPPAPAAPAPPSWILLEEVIEAAGGYSNIDLGGSGSPSQEALNAAIQGMNKTSSGNMHIKSSSNWSIGQAVAYAESIGYRGRYSIEINQDPAIRIAFNEIIANMKNTLDPKFA